MSHHKVAYTAHASPGYAALPRAPRFSITEAFSEIVRALVHGYKYRQTVGRLSELSDHTLSDIGLRRQHIHAVARKATDRYLRNRYIWF